MKKLAIPVIGCIFSVLMMGFTTRPTFMQSGAERVVVVSSNDWDGQVWVEKKTYGDRGRTVTDWHLMATNVTGKGHCLEGIIIVDGEKVPVHCYVSANADSEKAAESIYHLPRPFTIKKNSFHSVEGYKCQ